ncbi:ABC transporter ATP-binding protein [Stenotrophomonas sp. S41]|uniref:ABC transporter ATP-binding protein n=1 Tax=Stenotrophomonas sp. S41 TaxID=2767464 RepID=UPI00190D8445|nr:ABC transporter ATP-binding protein [Stenotrophomonas sp. S41]MBK0011899.1 ABC transporter ATP-binding protein [Stenotrophomonas sp. S41]
MIRELVQSGYKLSGTRDARLTRGLVWSAIEGLFAAAPYPLLYLLLRDAFTGQLQGPRIAWLAAGMALCVVLRIVAGSRGMPLVFTGAYALMGEARLRIADHLRRLPMGWFTRQRGGDLAARLTSDLELVENLWSHFLGVFVAGVAMPSGLLVFLAWLDWRLALVVAATVPVAVLALMIAQWKAGAAGVRVMEASATANAELQDYLQGIATIRSSGRFGQAWARLQSALDEQHRAVIEVESRPAPWVAAYGFVLETGFVLLAVAGVWLSAQGRLPVASLVAFLVLAAPLYRQLFDLGLSVLLLRFGRRALARIEQLLEVDALAEPTSALSPAGQDIELRNVHFSYDGESGPALQGISTVLPARRLTAVVGPSGSGKSTLVHLIARLWEVDEGAILLGGTDLREIGTDALHGQVAMVFQDVVLFSGSVLDNLRIGRIDASREQVQEAARRAQAHEFIMALPQGYDTLLDEGGASLSGGERQRISIARALLKDAPVLLLDEATASVDPTAEVQIRRAMSELATGRTVVVIAHRLQSVRHADHIVVLEQGRLVEQGRHESLCMAGGTYARLWAAQQAG